MINKKSIDVLKKLNNKLQRYVEKSIRGETSIRIKHFPIVSVGDTFRGEYLSHKYVHGGFWHDTEEVFYKLIEMEGRYYLVQTDSSFEPTKPIDSADCLEYSSGSDLFEWFISPEMVLQKVN